MIFSSRLNDGAPRWPRCRTCGADTIGCALPEGYSVHSRAHTVWGRVKREGLSLVVGRVRVRRRKGRNLTSHGWRRAACSFIRPMAMRHSLAETSARVAAATSTQQANFWPSATATSPRKRRAPGRCTRLGCIRSMPRASPRSRRGLIDLHVATRTYHLRCMQHPCEWQLATSRRLVCPSRRRSRTLLFGSHAALD
jgi:hypothetical protein